MQYNHKTENFLPYKTVEGDYPVRLDANESFLEPNARILQKLEDIVKTVPFNRYPDAKASEVCKAFADYYGVPAENVTAGNGSDELIFVIMSAFLEKWDRFITLSPDFSMYSLYGKLVEGREINLRKDAQFQVDVDALIATAKQLEAKLLIFSNPCNPTSLGLEREAVRRILRKVDALVVLDEAYMDFWDQSLLTEFADYENLIILRTCSKALGMAAIRLGFAVANTKITKILRAAKSPYNVNALTQAVGKALFADKVFLRENTLRLIQAREMLYASLLDLQDRFPGCFTVLRPRTNFVVLQTPAAPVLFECLKDEGILVRQINNTLRITVGSAQENQQLMDALKKIWTTREALAR